MHEHIESLLKSKSNRKLKDLQGIICYKGPGSFTGLRIGLTVANALAAGLEIPIVAENGEEWIRSGVDALASGKNDGVALPEYGSPAHITLPKH